jgi:UDP-glucose:glycoprotein glucosyltransferase
MQVLAKKKIASADKPAFQAAVADRPVRSDRQSLSFEEVLQSRELDDVVTRTAKYLKRLDIEGTSPPSLVNGVVLSRNENWLQEMPMRLSRDLQVLQQGVMADIFQEDSWLPNYFIFQAAESRNEWIIPEDPSNIRIVNLPNIADTRQDIVNSLLRISSDEGDATNSVHLVVIGDFNTESGLDLLIAALKFRQSHAEAEVIPLHNPNTEKPSFSVSSMLYRTLAGAEGASVTELLAEIESLKSSESTTAGATDEEFRYWTEAQLMVKDFGFVPGSLGAVLNGRAVGPLPSGITFSEKEFEQLLAYELSRRLEPVSQALNSLNLESKISDPLSFAKLSSLVALSITPDIPEGIFESNSKLRQNVFKSWNDTYSAITVSNSDDPTISIVVTLDPTTELSQRWVPILKALSKLAGVNVKIFLSPRDHIQELPIKRFYRHVLEPEPSFEENGSLIRPGASFSGLPKEALLNLGMDVPPSWLVAPKESIHDLDNIKLDSLKDGTNIDAIYALEHILIEGHSRDTRTKSPPRGVQLVLGTDKDPHFADTIIMANLGYFQFKAQPGFWKIGLKPGRSQRIFNLESVGGQGYTPTPGDENNEVALLSFQGKTLFPRLSRKPGHEDEDVLETGPKPGSAMDYVSKGLNFASGVLSNVGISPKSETAEKHADINIFSVASGHLYERMLNIMMVSVMKHTKHTVKFWFIEQFLSPSFKSFLRHLAKEYGFSYEMVTYKWPHWLRHQREKQREIWGYKILFLDVLFPLSLDKVIFVDADQIVRTDMYDLVSLDLEGAPYGFTPMCDSRVEMEGFRFWKQGYWKTFLHGLPYHISALYVVDLNRFRALAAGDRLRGQYQTLSADPASLSNLDQDLPNHMQHVIPIKSLSQDWLWCETWCSDEALTTARTIDLCNNPLTKEPKLDRARRQLPEWTAYDDEIAALAKRVVQASAQTDGRQLVEEEGKDTTTATGRDRKDEL